MTKYPFFIFYHTYYSNIPLLFRDFHKIRNVDGKHIRKAKKLFLSNFSNIANNEYKYTHSSGKTSFIDKND